MIVPFRLTFGTAGEGQEVDLSPYAIPDHSVIRVNGYVVASKLGGTYNLVHARNVGLTASTTILDAINATVTPGGGQARQENDTPFHVPGERIRYVGFKNVALVDSTDELAGHLDISFGPTVDAEYTSLVCGGETLVCSGATLVT